MAPHCLSQTGYCPYHVELRRTSRASRSAVRILCTPSQQLSRRLLHPRSHTHVSSPRHGPFQQQSTGTVEHIDVAISYGGLCWRLEQNMRRTGCNPPRPLGFDRGCGGAILYHSHSLPYKDFTVIQKFDIGRVCLSCPKQSQHDALGNWAASGCRLSSDKAYSRIKCKSVALYQKRRGLETAVPATTTTREQQQHALPRSQSDSIWILMKKDYDVVADSAATAASLASARQKW
jgi:hypothetical protein